MQQAAANEHLTLESVVTSKVAAGRLALGLLQGLVLYFLYHAAKTGGWPATQPALFAPLLLVWLLVPVILISSLGHLSARTAVVWIALAAAVIAGLAFHDFWRGSASADYGAGVTPDWRRLLPSGLLIAFSIAGFYIAHALVLAGAQDRRRIARYATYFEAAWKLAIQLAFSALFVGALWLVLSLGAELFMLVQLDFLKMLLREAWFNIPVIAFAFAFSCAMYITDVRPAIVRGIRTLVLVLLSWILPIATLIVGGFLLSLAGTGLQALWATRHATSVLLGALAVLVLLINAAFQNGEAGLGVARAIRVSARIAALLLLPMVAIAVYSLGLRVNDYGWTSDRVIAAACLLVAACYAAGYAWAALRRDGWLSAIAEVNVATAFVVLAVLLALFTPLADPARLSVASQVARLESGKVGVDKFDFNFLRFDGARYGLAALERLKSHARGPDAARVQRLAQAALDMKSRSYPGAASVQEQATPADIAANLHAWPPSATLPESLLQEPWHKNQRQWELPRCLLRKAQACDAYLLDFSGDGKPELLLVGVERATGAALMREDDSGRWIVAGHMPPDLAGCAVLREQLKAGGFRLVAPRLRDLEVAGQRIAVQETNQPAMTCPR